MIYEFLKNHAYYTKPASYSYSEKGTSEYIYIPFWVIYKSDSETGKAVKIMIWCNGRFIKGMELLPKSKLNTKKLYERTWKGLVNKLKKGKIELDGQIVSLIGVAPAEIPNEYKDILLPYKND